MRCREWWPALLLAAAPSIPLVLALANADIAPTRIPLTRDFPTWGFNTAGRSPAAAATQVASCALARSRTAYIFLPPPGTCADLDRERRNAGLGAIRVYVVYMAKCLAASIDGVLGSSLNLHIIVWWVGIMTPGNLFKPS